jgi:hypothetical protein
MKLSELLAKLEQVKRFHPHDDPEVVVKLSNPSMGGSAVANVYLGGDWNKGRLMFHTEDTICRAVHTSLEQLEERAQSFATNTHEKLGFEYARKRRDAWIDGFIEGHKVGVNALADANTPGTGRENK